MDIVMDTAVDISTDSVETKETDEETEKSKERKPLSLLMEDTYTTMKLRNGSQLVLSSVDAMELGLWTSEGKKLKNKEMKQLRKVGKATVESEFYMKSKKSRIVFDEQE